MERRSEHIAQMKFNGRLGGARYSRIGYGLECRSVEIWRNFYLPDGLLSPWVIIWMDKALWTGRPSKRATLGAAFAETARGNEVGKVCLSGCVRGPQLETDW